MTLHEHPDGYPEPEEVGDYLFPTSYAQQRLWFLERLLGASGLYNINWAIRLTGRLDVPALQQSFAALVARHETLRTSFVEQDGEPVQIIRSALPFQCTVKVLPTHQEREIQGLLDAEASKPFDLKAAPLIRALLLVVAEGQHILLTTLHHSIADGWSMAVFRQELAHFYRAFSQGQALGLPELPIHYADYAVWQRESLQGEVLERQLAYWQRQVSGLSVLELPTDRPRPKRPSYQGAQIPIHLPAELAQGLNALAQQHNATLFMALLAAVQTLLHRYSGQDDIAVGTAIAGRNREELENLIGFFVNTLVLRGDLSGNPSFCQLLGKTRKTCLEAYSHQDLPFEKLVAEAPNQRDTGRHPLFQVMLVLQPQPLPEPHWPGLLVGPIGVAHDSAKFDLLFSLAEHPDGLVGVAEYSTDLFDAATITRMVGHLQTLLTAIVRQPETAIAELELLTAPERKQLDSWNATTTLYPRDQCVHQLFEAQAARTPDAIALVFGEQQLSYQALNAKANQLAHHLRTLGVRPETVVAIGMERCLDLVIGLLAILKAGGVYLPLDPTYPKERLAFMLHDSQAPLLLTQSALLAQWPDYSGQRVCLDTCWPRLAQESVSNPPCQSVATQLAYIMYTSGSTGFPKGVKVCHYNIVRLLCNTDYARFDDRQRFLLLAPIAFDASVFEVWGGLLHGGCCVIYPQRTLMLDVLETIIVRQHITTLWLTAALFNAIIDEKPLILSTVAQILVGGEALSPSHIQRALQHLPDSQLINGYGPTESTTFACCYPIPKTTRPANAIPIGWPIANTQAYILDRHLQPVPIGVVGEIHIGGDGLARGYLNQPELTAEKFIAHPFSADPAARLYKTGDLGHYLPDGAIDFLGRFDHQVKLRGFRIELGEIEAALGQYPGIKEVAVIVREDVPGDKRLVAYLTQPPQGRPDIKALREHIKAKLPEYMMPSAFVFLANLPLTANGKLDRNALPAPGHTRQEQAQSYIPPSSPAEAALAAIWQEVLAVAHIGSHDNFFDLGGHSLLALVLCTKIEAKMGMPVPLELIFQCPTVSQLAKALAEGGTLADKNPSPILTAFQAEGNRPPFFWGLDGKIFAMLLEQIDVDQPLYLLKHQSTEGHKAKHRTIPEMAAYYIQGILQIDPVGPYYLGGYSVGGMIMYEVARQLCAQGKKVALLFMLDPPPIYQSGGKDRPICTLLWRRECDNLSYLGYVVYIRRLLVKLKMSFIISTYFYRKKPVPAQFFWPSVEPVYLKAMLIYKPGRIVGDIEKIVLVSAKKSVKKDSHADWAHVFDEADTYRVDCEHLDLKKEAFAFMWLDIFKRVLETVSRKAS